MSEGQTRINEIYDSFGQAQYEVTARELNKLVEKII
jgi:hypothetical protein